MLPLLPLTLLSLSYVSLVAAQFREFIITNRCPEEIPLYIGGEPMDPLAANGGQVSKTLQSDAGAIYTTANGGNANGTGTTRAGFFDNNFYYIVVDRDHFNTGIAITPLNYAPNNGFCTTAVCTVGTCTTAFDQPPTRFPAPADTPPAAPGYRCPSDPDTGYYVEFCPGGRFPTPSEPQPPTTVTLHPNGNTAKCADVRGAVFANGTPVQIYDCNGTPAQKWVINRGATKVQLADTNFCLDAGSTPGNGVGSKIWTCYDNLPAQAWYYTDDNRIALEGQGFCLDLPNGVLTNSNQLQTWRCTDNNNNQVWTT